MTTFAVQVQLLLLAAVVCAAAAAPCPEATPGIKPWSTWIGKPSNSAYNATVTVPADAVLLLDEAPPLMKQLIILGQLVVHPSKSFEIKAYSILVSGNGHFWVGSPQCPIQGRIVFTLFGARLPGVNPAFVGTKSIGVNSRGSLDMHGAPKTPSWTVLAQTAPAGATTITLSKDVDWKIGDEIFITGTDFESFYAAPKTALAPQWERRFVNSRPGTNQVGFAMPLNYTHWAKTWTSPNGKDKVDMRAEVGVLTRNVLVRGDASSLISRWGAHIMIVGNSSSARLSNIEVTNAGQAGEMARYPIHFHLAKNQSKSYIKSCAVHTSLQRCYTIHGTHALLLSENICFNTFGHGFFIEDGDEQQNVLHSNLAVAMRPHNLLLSDSEPSCFWITNPSNHFYDNHASTCRHGYWYAMTLHPTGKASDQTTLWPRNMRMGDFKRNVAHSCGTGLQMDRGDVNEGIPSTTPYAPCDWSTHLPYVGLAAGEDAYLKVATLDSTPRSSFGSKSYLVVDEFVAWKCSEGIWANGRAMSFVVRTALVDNMRACTFPGHSNIVENSVFVGETDNVGYTDICYGCNPRMDSYEGRTRVGFQGYGKPIIGYNQYDSGGPNMVVSSRFYNFKDEKLVKYRGGMIRPAGAISSNLAFRAMPPTNRFLNVSFINVDNVMYSQTRPDAFIASAVIIDHDGSLTGTCGAVITGPSSQLHTSACKYNSTMVAWICPPGTSSYNRYRIDEGRNPLLYVGNSSEVGSQTNLNIVNILNGVSGWSAGDWGSPTTRTTASGATETVTSVAKGYHINIMTNAEYLHTTGSVETSTPVFTQSFLHLRSGEWVRFAMPYPVGTIFTCNVNVPAADSLAAMIAARKDGWFYDSSTALLWTQFYRTDDTFSYVGNYPVCYTESRMTITASCPRGLCNQKPPTKVTPNVSPYASNVGANRCEKNGAYINGNLVPSAIPGVGSDRFDIFTDSMPTGWTNKTDSFNYINSCTVSSESVYQGKSAIRCKTHGLNRESYITFYVPPKAAPISLAPYTHIVLTVRSSAALGPMSGNLAVTIQGDSTAQSRGRSVSVTSPYHSSSGPIKDTWATYVIPLKEFALPLNSLWSVYIGLRIINPTLYYIDNLLLAKLTVSTSTKDPRYPPTFAVPPLQVNLNTVLNTRLADFVVSSSAPAPAPKPELLGDYPDSVTPDSPDALPIPDTPSNSTDVPTLPPAPFDTSKEFLNVSAASKHFGSAATTTLIAGAFLAVLVF